MCMCMCVCVYAHVHGCVISLFSLCAGGYYGFRSATSLGVVAVLLFLSVLAGLGTWGVIAQRRRRKMVTMMMGKTRPTIDGEEGNCAVAANNSLVRVGSSPTVIKRK